MRHIDCCWGFVALHQGFRYNMTNPYIYVSQSLISLIINTSMYEFRLFYRHLAIGSFVVLFATFNHCKYKYFAIFVYLILFLETCQSVQGLYPYRPMTQYCVNMINGISLRCRVIKPNPQCSIRLKDNLQEEIVILLISIHFYVLTNV